MSDSMKCPRCHVVLETVESEAETFSCGTCRGIYVRGAETPNHFLAEMAKQLDSNEGETEQASNRLECPGCQQQMQEVRLEEAAIDYCTECGGTWLDEGEKPGDGSPGAAGASAMVSRYLLFGLSLPERVLRSGVGVAAGAAKETATFLIPQAFQSSKTYEVVLKNALKFLTEDVGGVEGKQDEQPMADDFVARKAVGNFVDMAGWATLHLSPVWFMAIVSDVAYGTKEYVSELADELKKQGLIDENSTINNVDDVLDAVQNASGQTASLFDTPPLSVEQLRESLEKTRASITSADYRRVLPEAELKSYWNEMRQISNEEGVSLIGVSGALTMHTLGKVSTVSKGTLAGVQVVGGLFSRHVVGHYADALEEIRSKGFYQMVNDSSAPYIEAVWSNFSIDKETWTEQLVSGKALGKAFKMVGGLFGGESESKATPESERSSKDEPAGE